MAGDAYKISRIRSNAIAIIEACSDLTGEDNSNAVDLELAQIAKTWAEVYDILGPKTIIKEDEI